MFVAYWHREGLEIYEYRNGNPVRYASGALDSIKPLRRIFGKKILVVGRELLLFSRKRYPPASKEKLLKALELEIKEIFPLSNPDFYCMVSESSRTSKTLDIWAWESHQYEQLKKIFPFQYVVPEDLLYFSEVPEIKVFKHRGLIHLLAHSKERFLMATSYSEAAIEEREIERFFSGLTQYKEEIKRIKIYGLPFFQFKDPQKYEILRLEDGDYPPCLKELPLRKLKEFKVKAGIHFPSKMDFLFRILIYLILGYGFLLFLSSRNYDQATKVMKENINLLDKKISLNKDITQKREDYSDIITEINEKIKGKPSPLRVMELLAHRLPPESFVNRIILNENHLEISVSSKNPIPVIRALGDAKEVKALRLRGTPTKDGSTGLYNFIIMIDLLRD